MPSTPNPQPAAEETMPHADAVAALAAAISDLSEECYAAGWIGGVEHAAWALMVGDIDRYGISDRDELAARLASLLILSTAAGGWVERDDDLPGRPPVRFVPLAEWRDC